MGFLGELFLVLEMFDLADPPSWNFERKARVCGITFGSSFPLHKSALRGFRSDCHPQGDLWEPWLHRGTCLWPSGHIRCLNLHS